MLNILAFSTLLAGVACSPSPSAPVAPGTNPAVDGASQAVNATSNASVGQVAVSSKSWPNFRGPSWSGVSPETGLNKNWSAKQPKLLWQMPMGDKGYAGPAVANGVLYIIDHSGSDDIVRAVNFTTGKPVWTFIYPDSGEDNYGFSRSTPTVDNGKVYTVSREGQVHCLDAAKGSVIWKKNMPQDLGGQAPGWRYAWSPVIDGNKLILLPGGGKSVAALDKNTGNVIWQGGPSEATSYSSPVVATIGGKKQYVVFLAKGLYGVDAENGATLWKVGWTTSYDVNAAQPIVIGNDVFITSGYGHGCAMISVSGNSASIKWQNKTIQGQFASSVFVNGKIYGTGDPGNLVCLDPATGSTIWSQGGFEKGGICVADGLIYALNGGNGDLILVKCAPTGYAELGRVKPLGDQSWTAPILADGKVVVRNKSALAVIDVK